MAAEAKAIILSTQFCVWSVMCDGCLRLVTVACPTDRQAIEFALQRAVELGWSIAPDRFIRQRRDLCPECRKGEGSA